ncbi:MAG: hypothetical protein EDM03_07440 [Porphyrobacter sp. IPPAS B-1204]|nr:MAG: hypothetical protein EDM03_07440 [Porphyrobacter sp. IPPAS B-1204]
MTEFIKKLFPAETGGEAQARRPEGKFGVIGKVAIPHSKGFTVVRKDIMQKALAAKRTNEAA